MFEHAKVGDQVWSYTNGYGIIIKITGGDFPINVRFDDGRGQNYFTIDGKRFKTDENPILFWDKIEFEIPEKTLPNIETDTKVLVWDNIGDTKEKRHFKKFSEYGTIFCFPDGKTSWSCKYNNEEEWNFWELAEENTDV